MREQVYIADIMADEEFAPYREAATKAGIRSVLSLSLIGDGDVPLGVMSLHHATPSGSPTCDLMVLKNIAEFTAGAIVRHL